MNTKLFFNTIAFRTFLTSLALLCSGLGVSLQAEELAGTWSLEKGKMTYTVNHILKTVQGSSEAAKGKSVCSKDSCDYLVAVPVKSFESENSNRDTNMIHTMKASEFPMVKVSGKILATQMTAAKGTLENSAEVELAGVKKTLALNVQFERVSASELKLKFSMPLKLSDFNIERPSLLTTSIDDLVPVDCELSWKK